MCVVKPMERALHMGKISVPHVHVLSEKFIGITLTFEDTTLQT